MSKRSKEDYSGMAAPAWWESTVEWIRSNGGTIDSSLSLTTDRNVINTEGARKGDILMKIPSSCLVCRDNILSTSSGKLLESIINDESISFYNQRPDLLIAVSLANKEDFQRYLDTLPSSSDYDMLPRRWSDSELSNLLTGSCLLDRAKTSREETRNDYEKIKQGFRKHADDKKPFHISYSDFDDMLAAVTSRAFAGMGESSRDDDVAMIPLLDLCNHRRGGMTKNVSYSKTDSGSVLVVASEDLDANAVLAITYGARGNAQLLFNYGFCIENNFEPDGSSNDVLEFKAKDEVPPVDLRSGPKSYTFGGFTKVLELFHETASSENVVQGDNDGGFYAGGMDDMEAFLNECDEDGEGGGWDEDECDDELEEAQPSEDEAIKAELIALNAMGHAFDRANEKYLLHGHELEKALVSPDATKRHYAAILVASELRTILLYQQATELVRAKLQKEEDSAIITCRVSLTRDENERVRAQAIELAQAFIGIRYPFL